MVCVGPPTSVAATARSARAVRAECYAGGTSRRVAGGAPPGDRQVRNRDHEASTTAQLLLERGYLVSAKLRRGTAGVALQVGVLAVRADVVLLASVGTVAVDDEPEFLEGVERPIDGRRSHVRIDGAAPLDEFAGSDMAEGRAEDLEDRSPLRSPAHPSFSELLANALGSRSCDLSMLTLRTITCRIVTPCYC